MMNEGNKMGIPGFYDECYLVAEKQQQAGRQTSRHSRTKYFLFQNLLPSLCEIASLVTNLKVVGGSSPPS